VVGGIHLNPVVVVFLAGGVAGDLGVADGQVADDHVVDPDAEEESTLVDLAGRAHADDGLV